ncbi:MAG: DUF1592 domain-containing protein [Chitinophagaceae bacterium]|nr:DUF1592 domain-containing protein [Oligoflexus sp.]
MKLFRNRPELLTSVTVPLLCFICAGACSSPPPSRPQFNSAGAASSEPLSDADGKAASSAGKTNADGSHSISLKMRALSSVEAQNTIMDLYGVSLDTLIADHPSEATNTGYFNDVSSFVMTTPLAKWYGSVASLVAGKLSLSTPVLKGLPVCPVGDQPCLETNLIKVATQTYRRVPSKAETDALLASIAKSGAKTYLEGMSVGLEIMLQSAQFVFHAEGANVNGVLNGSYAVASRLAAVLWQSTPDAILLDAAAKGGLMDETSVKPQVARMLADSRSIRGLGQFAIEWLRLYTISRRDLMDATQAGATQDVINGMLNETERTFAAAAMDPKGDFLEGLFAPKNTFLTPSLAKWYGVTLPARQGTDAVQVPIAANSVHRGIMTQASFLFATTKRSSTSLITRGNGVLEMILCKVAGAPSDADLLEAAKDAAVKRSKKDESTFRMAKPACGGCHSKFDPMGLMLEKYDYLGRPRTVDENNDPVSTAVSFTLDDKSVNFPDALSASAAFAKSPEVGRCVTSQMMSYAFAGNLLDPKGEAIDSIYKAFVDSGHSFQALITAIVLTPEFLEP